VKRTRTPASSASTAESTLASLTTDDALSPSDMASRPDLFHPCRTIFTLSACVLVTNYKCIINIRL
jgi:hypothetical protein